MKKSLIVYALIAFLACAAITWAVNNYILSNHVPVEVEEYKITLEANITRITLGETILFSGTYSYANSTGDYWMTGETVTLWYNTTDTGQTDVTDSNGYYEIPFTPSTVGTYDFYANATIT